MIMISVVYLSLLILSIDGKPSMLLNGAPFPGSMFVPMDKSYVLECQATKEVYWKIYSYKGKVQIISNAVIRLNEYDPHRDGLYQCHLKEEPCQTKHVFIFSNGARAIDRHWSGLTHFHPMWVARCRPLYFNFGFNEQFIELIDSQQLVRYNASALRLKDIRSTTHLSCKLYLDTISVGVRVHTLIRKDHHESPVLSDQYLQKNDYLDLKTKEHDFQRIAFEGDSVYFHCPKHTSVDFEWTFLSWNYYLTKTLPIQYHTDTKLSAVKIQDAGMYTCQHNNTIQKRVILTVLHPPRSPNCPSQETRDVQWNSKHLICCRLDALPYPSYSWTMKTETDSSPVTWCLKRCCWIHILHRTYDPLICTSSNVFGMKKYTVHLRVQDVDGKGQIVYHDEK